MPRRKKNDWFYDSEAKVPRPAYAFAKVGDKLVYDKYAEYFGNSQSWYAPTRPNSDHFNFNTSGTGTSSTDFFSADIPDLDAFIRQLDLLNDDVNKALRRAMHEGAKIISYEQQMLANMISFDIASFISESDLEVIGNGQLSITTGLLEDAFDFDNDSENIGIIGMTWEFGRPGESPKRNTDTMEQIRNGKKYKVIKGRINPRPFIRPGFDRTVKAASQRVIDVVNRETGKVFNE